ncbi:MAG: hypothetical protein KAR06_11720, partial [Deltaproteobacteria bacterium]|nr:hypothetical protein [Deltaproteobacteria bacterium]
MNKKITSRSGLVLLAVVAALIMLTSPTTSSAGITIYKEGDKYVKVGGRIHLQYNNYEPEAMSATDDLFLRRFRPYIEMGLFSDFSAKFEWDMAKGSGDNELSVQGAYVKYSGIEDLSVIIGNYVFPFSREVYTSSNNQQLVERTFVGDHNFGVPDMVLGLHLKGSFMDKKLELMASYASAAVDPLSKKLDIESPVNSDSDFNEGWIYGVRVDYHPLGNLKMSQGDFDRELKATVSLALEGWENDGDNNTNTLLGSDTSIG